MRCYFYTKTIIQNKFLQQVSNKTMRVLHTADWHLGRIFHGIYLTEDQAYILEQIKTIAHDQQVDVVVVAGDIFDRAVPPPEAVKLLDEFFYDITFNLKIPVVMIAGNHDSPERLNFGSRLFSAHSLFLTGTLQFPLQPVVLNDHHGPVHFYSIPYSEPSLVREKTADTAVTDHDSAMSAMVKTILADQTAKRRILCTHSFIQGGLISDSERPISIGGSGSVNASVFGCFTCVLCGHLHQHQWIDTGKIHYSGSPLKYSFSEVNHQKTVTILNIDAEGGVTSEYIPLNPKHNVRCIEGTLSDILSDSESDNGKEDYIMVKLMDELPVLDAIGKIRKVYPNVLHLERPSFEYKRADHGAVDHRKLTDEDLFAAFFSQLTGALPTDEQRTSFAEIAAKIHKKEREANA